jgi:hypothetical protein
MFRIRTILIVVLLACLIYWLLPDERKARLRGRAREFWRALVLALVIYWVYMIALALARYWRGS